MNNFLLTLILLAIFSCTTTTQVVDVASLNQKTQKILGQAEKGLQRVESDFSEHEQILIKWGDDKSRQNLKRMLVVKQNLTQNYIRLKEDFEGNPYREKLKISSKEKEYSAFNKYQSGLNVRFEVLDKQFDTYKSESLKLNAYLETKSLYRINPQHLRDDFINSLNEAKSMQLVIKNKLMDYNVNFNQSSINENQKAQQKLLIQELVKIVEQMEDETFRLQRLFNRVMNEINTGIKFVTPKMKSYNYLGQIEKKMRSIQARRDEFNLKSKNLKL